MTLNELSRYHWARMNQAGSMEVALKHFDAVDEVHTWYALLNWAFYTDIADEIHESHDFMEFAEATLLSRGVMNEDI